MNKNERTIIAKETVEIIHTGSYMAPDGSVVDIAAQLAHAVDRTRLYRPEDFPNNIATAETGTRPAVEVTGETSLEAAARLIDEGAPTILCLNFASAKNPGGGFLGGSQAQEESLARSSGLYATLLKAGDMYDYHRNLGTCLYSDHMIYSPDVPVFRNDAGRLLSSPYTLSFITSPAVNAGAVAQNEPHNIPYIQQTMVKRLHRLLWIARQHGHRTLILGAWGCGVFRNDPRMIAELFHDALGEGGAFYGDFSRIVYAVYDNSPEQSALNAFRKVLSAG